jgi:2-haloacid dehalogenase
MSEHSAGTVAFDVIGTLFSLDRVRTAFRDEGAPEGSLERWLAGGLRDYFAVSHSGGYVPFKDVLADGLDEDLRPAVLEAILQLEPATGAAAACRLLDEEGWRIVTLTNASEALTRSLLEGAGLADLFHSVLSCDSISKSKPHPDVYALAVREAVGPLWMVASHPWDLGGAARAGLHTAWIQHEMARWPVYLPAPEQEAGDLTELAGLICATARA